MDTTKSDINVLVFGENNSGKATILGHLFSKFGSINQSELEEIESKETNENSKYKSIVDHLKNEREKGFTEDLKICRFKINKASFKVVDVSGHKNFIKNLLLGTSQAHIGFFIIDSSKEISKEGHVFEQLSLVQILGIKQVILCVNKMDQSTVNWSQSRFEEIKDSILIHLERIAFKPTFIEFIPISGLSCDSLFEKSKNLDWIKGPTLTQALENIPVPINPNNRPLRIPLQDVYKISGKTVSVGRIESGTLKLEMNISIAPGDITTQVESFETISGGITDTACTGDNMGFSLKNIDSNTLKRGYVCGDTKNDPPKTAIEFDALIYLREDPGKIEEGSNIIVDCHTAHLTCQVKEIKTKIHERNGTVVEANLKTLDKGDCVIITLVPTKPLCVEAFSDYPTLGRFAIRGEKTQNIGYGIIKSVLKKGN